MYFMQEAYAHARVFPCKRFKGFVRLTVTPVHNHQGRSEDQNCGVELQGFVAGKKCSQSGYMADLATVSFSDIEVSWITGAVKII
jgi:hypothetical protein